MPGFLFISLSLSLSLFAEVAHIILSAFPAQLIGLIQSFLVCALFQAQLEVVEAVAGAGEARVSGISTLARQHSIATASSQSPCP